MSIREQVERRRGAERRDGGVVLPCPTGRDHQTLYLPDRDEWFCKDGRCEGARDALNDVPVCSDVSVFMHNRHGDCQDCADRKAFVNERARIRAREQVRAAGEEDVWDFVDFDAVDAEEPEPTLGEVSEGVYLWRPGTINGLHGRKGGAKTWVLYALMVSEMHRGNHALLLDAEMGGKRVKQRMRLLGATEEELRTLLHCVRPKGPMSAKSLDKLADRIAATGGILTMVGIDTVVKSMTLSGVDSNNADQVTSWFAAVPGPIVEAFPTATVVILDHVPKSAEDSLFPIGSEAKAANVDTQYLVRSTVKFSKEKDGYSDLVCAKNRDGDYNEGEAVVRFHGGPHGFRFEMSQSDGSAGDGDLTIDLTNVPDLDGLWDELDTHTPDGILQTKFCGHGAAGQMRKVGLKTLEGQGRARCEPGGRSGRGFRWFAL